MNALGAHLIKLAFLQTLTQIINVLKNALVKTFLVVMVVQKYQIVYGVKKAIIIIAWIKLIKHVQDLPLLLVSSTVNKIQIVEVVTFNKVVGGVAQKIVVLIKPEITVKQLMIVLMSALGDLHVMPVTM